jgi:Flp pilus assembly protein TadD
MGMVVLSLGVGRDALARPIEEQICNAGADYSLGIEDYAEAVRLHQEVLRQHPDNALAHYHLGFAEGMMGRRAAEIAEYQRAEALGLENWDLFLNLGLAQFEEGELDGAATSLRRAVLLGEDHFESHFNLALVDERRGMLAEAERETLAALRLSPRQTEALNLQGVICAREGETVRASRIFQEVIREQPDYQPARANLLMLAGLNADITAETPGKDPPTSGVEGGAARDQRRPSATGPGNVTAARFEP